MRAKNSAFAAPVSLPFLPLLALAFLVVFVRFLLLRLVAGCAVRVVKCAPEVFLVLDFLDFRFLVALPLRRVPVAALAFGFFFFEVRARATAASS